MFAVLLSTWAMSYYSFVCYHVNNSVWILLCLVRNFPTKLILLEIIDQSKPRNFRQIVGKDRILSRICPAIFPLGHLMVSKVPASQLLEHFAITSTSSPTVSQAFRLLDLILGHKEEPQLPDLYQFFFLCLFPLHSPIQSYPRGSASLISSCISLFQVCILVLGPTYVAKITETLHV